MADFEVKVSGLQELQRSLYAFSRQLGDKVVIAALKEGARVMQKDAKQRAPFKTGRLRRGIVVKKSKINNGRARPVLGVYLSLRKGKGKKDPKDAFYGRFIENGWTDRSGKRRPGRKFMSSAFNAKREASLRVIVQAFERGASILKQRLGLR